MITFVFLAILLTLITLAILSIAYFSPSSLLVLDRKKQNIELAKSRLSYLDQALAEGNMEQAIYLDAKKEIEADLLIDIDNLHENTIAGKNEYSSFILIAAFIGIMAALLYWHYGRADYLEYSGAGAGAVQEQGQDADTLVTKLAEKMQEHPDNVEGWFLLGRSYHTLGRYKEAVDALEKAYKLEQQEPAILLTLADALIMLNKNHRSQGRPAQLIAKALALAPDDPSALWLSSIVAEDKQDYQQALVYLRKLLPVMEKAAPSEAKELRIDIKRLEDKLGIASPTIAKISGIELTIKLAPELAEKVSPDNAVFIYAVAMQGPKMPLAVVRTVVSKLPLTVILDDSKAMLPNMRLSLFPQVKIGARISKNSGAIAQKGDLQGELQNITVAKTPKLEIIINQIVE